MKRDEAKMLKGIELQQESAGKRYQCERKFIAGLDPINADHCYLVSSSKQGRNISKKISCNEGQGSTIEQEPARKHQKAAL